MITNTLPPYIYWIMELEKTSIETLELGEFSEKIEQFKNEYTSINEAQQKIVQESVSQTIETLARAHRIGVTAKTPDTNYELEKIVILGKWMMSLGGQIEKDAQQFVVSAIYECHPELVAKLLEEGWSPDWGFDNGTSALIAAVSRRDSVQEYRNIFNEILKYSPNLFLENDLGYNCLIKAVKHWGHYYIEKIIERTNDINHIDRFLADVHHKQETQTISQAEYQILFNQLKIKKEKMQLEQYLPQHFDNEGGKVSRNSAKPNDNARLLKI